LRAREWAVAGRPTIADVALYPYVKLAPEGGFDLAAWPAIGAWLARFEALPGYVAIDA
jgi:glutathione S-transferase